MVPKRMITRRDFMRTGSYLAAGGLVGLPLVDRARAQQRAKSRVVLIRDENLLDRQGRPKETRLGSMLDKAVTALFDSSEPRAAWRGLAGPGDVVGVKSNVWYYLPTPRELESVIFRRLRDAGVKEEHISFDDRGVRGNPVFKRATVLINVRPMRTHHWSGLGTLIKNYIMFVSWPPLYHGNACERLGAIWREPEIKGKTRLNILVMLTPLFHGIGPHHFSRKYTWPYCGLIVSQDPVAADATGARIIQRKRDTFFGEKRPISPPLHHIVAADRKYGLGNNNPANIELIRMGWDKSVLV